MDIVGSEEEEVVVVSMTAHEMLIARGIDTKQTFVRSLLVVLCDGNHWVDYQCVGRNHNPEAVVEVAVGLIEIDIVQVLECLQSY